MPRFQATIIERYTAYDVPDDKADQVRVFAQNHVAERDLKSKIWAMSISFQMKLFFLYSSGDYAIMQQYLVYDLGTFIADVGGYLVKVSIHLITFVMAKSYL